MAAATSTSGPAVPDELLPALHEEIARLPEKYPAARSSSATWRASPRPQAAGQLHWSERTLRLPAGRGARAGSRSGWPAAAWPRRRDARRRALREAPDRRAAGLERGDRPRGARSGQSHRVDRRGRLGGGAVTHPGGAQDHVDPEADTGLGRPAGGRADGLGGLGRRDLARGRAPERRRRLPSAPAAPAPAPARGRTRPARPGRRRSRFAAGCSIPTASRSPAPRSTSILTVRRLAMRHEQHGSARSRRAGWRRPTPDGRFRFELDKVVERLPVPRLSRLARGPDRGRRTGVRPGLGRGQSLLKGDEATLRLVRDDVPIRGRVLDLQGQPVAGVTVRLSRSA